MTEKCPNCGVKHRSITFQECQDREMSEKTLQTRVMGRGKRKGWTIAHVGRAFIPFPDGGGIWITPMLEDWPDLTCFKAGHRIIFMELKKQDEEPRPGQLAMLQLLNETGNYAIVVRPSDLREGRVNMIFKDGSPWR